MSQVVPHNRRWLRELSGVQCCGRFHKDAPDCGPSSDCLAHAPKSFHLFDSSAVYIVEYVLVYTKYKAKQETKSKGARKAMPTHPTTEMRTMDDFLPSLHLSFVFCKIKDLRFFVFCKKYKKGEKWEP